LRYLTYIQALTLNSSLVIDHLEASEDRTAIALFYCNYRREAEYDTDYILKALLKQLALRKAAGQRNQSAVMHKTLAKVGGNLTEEICKLCTGFPQVYITVDAVEEMNQYKLMRFLFPALTAFVAAGIKVFTTSRPHISGGNEHFVNALEIAVEAHENDISVYIEKELNDSVAQDQDFAQLLGTSCSAVGSSIALRVWLQPNILVTCAVERWLRGSQGAPASGPGVGEPNCCVGSEIHSP
jgi:hypothetical protein